MTSAEEVKSEVNQTNTGKKFQIIIKIISVNNFLSLINSNLRMGCHSQFSLDAYFKPRNFELCCFHGQKQMN